MDWGSILIKRCFFDLEKDPKESEPISNPEVEEYFRKEMVRIMKENDAPKEQYVRMGLEAE